MSKEVISLEEFSDWHGEVNGIEIASTINLPEYAPVSDINVHIGRIASIAKFGRLAAVGFRTYNGDDSSFGGAVVSGINGDGSAVATRVRSGAVARSKAGLEKVIEPQERYPRSIARVGINTNHEDLYTGKLRTPEPWVRVLRKGMQEGLIKASHEQLLNPKLERRKGLTVSTIFDIGGFTLVAAILPDLSVSDIPPMLPILLPLNAGLHAIGWDRKFRNLTSRSNNDKFAENSLFPHLPIDRFAVVKLLSQRSLVSTAK